MISYHTTIDCSNYVRGTYRDCRKYWQSDIGIILCMFPCLSCDWSTVCVYVCLSVCLDLIALYFEQSHSFAIVKFGGIFCWLPLHSLFFWVVSSFMTKKRGPWNDCSSLPQDGIPFPGFPWTFVSKKSFVWIQLFQRYFMTSNTDQCDSQIRNNMLQLSGDIVQGLWSPEGFHLVIIYLARLRLLLFSRVLPGRSILHIVITRNGSVWPWP